MTQQGGVARTTARAAVWAFVSMGGAKLITLVGLIFLARLLAPAEFGLLAFALVYITYAETVGDLGSGTALVYWPDRREEAAQVTFLINLAAGTFWCVSTILIAPAIADFFNSPNGTPLVRTLAFSFLIKYLGNTHDALARKDLRFRARAVPELGLALLKAAISIALAYAGFGAWSLVWGHLAGLACWTAFLWFMVPWRPSFTLPKDLVKPMLRYGRGIIAVNIIASVLHHADLAIVGRFLGVTPLGLYQIAAKIPEATVIVLLWVVSSVLFPTFSKLHAAGSSLERPYLIATRYVSAVTFPAAVGLALLARPLLLLFFGPQWASAAPILSALAAYAGLRSITSHAGDILKATGRAQVLAGIAVVQALLLLPALLIGAMQSAVAVATALAIVELVAASVKLVIASRLINVRLFKIVRSFARSAVAAAILGGSLLAWNYYSANLSVLTQVIVGVAGGGVIYAIALRLVDPTIFAFAWEVLFKRKTAPADELARAASTS